LVIPTSSAYLFPFGIIRSGVRALGCVIVLYKIGINIYALPMTALLNAAFRSDWHFSFPDFYLTLCRPFLSGEAIVFTSNVVWLGVQCIDRTSVVKFYHIRFR